MSLSNHIKAAGRAGITYKTLMKTLIADVILILVVHHVYEMFGTLL